jgi:hypothetical protein
MRQEVFIVLTVGKKSVTVLKANGKTTKYPRGRIRLIEFAPGTRGLVTFEEVRDGRTSAGGALREAAVPALRRGA